MTDFKPPLLPQHVQRPNNKAREKSASDLERMRINSINTVVFKQPVDQVRNSSMPNGYRTPVWNIRECGNKLIKSVGV